MMEVRGEAEKPVLVEWRGAGKFGEPRLTDAFFEYGVELQVGTLLMLSGYAMALVMWRTKVEHPADEKKQEEVWRVVAETIREGAMEVLEKELLPAEAGRPAAAGRSGG